MKNKKSPLKFLGGAIGAAGATAGTAFGTQLLGAGLSGLFGGGNIAARNNEGGGTSAGGSVAGIGSQVQPVTDASAQFNPAAMQNMQGMFGDISGRQATLGASGIFALEKHLSPVNNDEEKPLYSEADWHKVSSVNDKYAVDVGTAYNTKKSDLTAYKSPNPPFDPTSEDDGAGGKEYDTN